MDSEAAWKDSFSAVVVAAYKALLRGHAPQRLVIPILARFGIDGESYVSDDVLTAAAQRFVPKGATSATLRGLAMPPGVPVTAAASVSDMCRIWARRVVGVPDVDAPASAAACLASLHALVGALDGADSKACRIHVLPVSGGPAVAASAVLRIYDDPATVDEELQAAGVAACNSLRAMCVDVASTDEVLLAGGIGVALEILEIENTDAEDDQQSASRWSGACIAACTMLAACTAADVKLAREGRTFDIEHTGIRAHVFGVLVSFDMHAGATLAALEVATPLFESGMYACLEAFDAFFTVLKGPLALGSARVAGAALRAINARGLDRLYLFHDPGSRFPDLHDGSIARIIVRATQRHAADGEVVREAASALAAYAERSKTCGDDVAAAGGPAALAAVIRACLYEGTPDALDGALKAIDAIAAFAQNDESEAIRHACIDQGCPAACRAAAHARLEFVPNVNEALRVMRRV